MAIWQFDLNAVCRQSGESLPLLLKARAESFLEGLISRQAQSDGWIVYGTNDGNCIELLSDHEGCELEVRIDARSDADTFVALVCLLMADLDCTLYSEELQEFIATDVSSIRDALQWSQAWRYALDSNSFMRSLHHQ